jgi:hypothetical protein
MTNADRYKAIACAIAVGALVVTIILEADPTWRGAFATLIAVNAFTIGHLSAGEPK